MENPCEKCIERDMCRGAKLLPCSKRKVHNKYKAKCKEIRQHMLEVMERAKKEKEKADGINV